MDAILRQLGELLLKAVPTFLLVVFLNFYLKAIFFRPLEKVLQRRYEATEGARKIAEETLRRANEKTAEYEAAIRAARSEVYQEQEKVHKELQEAESAQLLEARKRAEIAVNNARQLIAGDVEAAKASLASQNDSLANQITEAILRRSAA